MVYWLDALPGNQKFADLRLVTAMKNRDTYIDVVFK